MYFATFSSSFESMRPLLSWSNSLNVLRSFGPHRAAWWSNALSTAVPSSPAPPKRERDASDAPSSMIRLNSEKSMAPFRSSSNLAISPLSAASDTIKPSFSIA